MTQPGNRRVVNFVILAGLAALFVVFMMSTPASAGSRPQPVFQGTAAYEPPPTEGSGSTAYPPPEATTPASTTLQATPTLSGSPTPTATLTPTQTLAPNLFQTENAEMSGAQTTPALTDTPAPSLTPYLSPTATQAITASANPAGNAGGGGFQMNWGLFWIGFSAPVLAGCGLVLYLLDHRPDLFRSRRGAKG